MAPHQIYNAMARLITEVEILELDLDSTAENTAVRVEHDAKESLKRWA